MTVWNFDARLKLIAKQLSQYNHMHTIDAASLELCRKIGQISR